MSQFHRRRGEASWPRAAAFSQPGFGITLTSIDGSVFVERRSFILTSCHHKGILRLKLQEICWLARMFGFCEGEKTCCLYYGRVIGFLRTDRFTSIYLRRGGRHGNEVRMMFDLAQTQALGNLLFSVWNAFWIDWESHSVEEILHAFGVLRRRNVLNSDALQRFVRALGSRATGKPVEMLVEYGEKMDNPPVNLTRLADFELSLVGCLVP